MPRLSPEETSVSLLKDEPALAPVYEAFLAIGNRRFSSDELDKAAAYQTIPLSQVDTIEKERDLAKLHRRDLGLSAKLFFLSRAFKPIFDSVCDYYRMVFPFVTEIAILDLTEVHKKIAVPGKVPVFCIKERGVDNWIDVSQLSSGMQKVLLILADISVLPDGSLYIVDEYENSLGVNAIEFLPNYILELEKEIQFLITSHHPYLINAIPVADWYVFHRKGNQVTIKYGQELVERFGKSKQKAFTQLINDPFFLDGVE